MNKKIIALLLGISITFSRPINLNSYSINQYSLTTSNQKKKSQKKKVKTKPKTKKKTKKEKTLEWLSNEYGRKVESYRKIECTLSYYTDLPEENGGYTITATGEKLKYGIVANNSLKFGTNIYFKNKGKFKVKDRGCSNFNKVNRYDVFIPKNYGESNSSYLKRVNNLGKTKVVGYIVKFKK